MNNIKKAPWDLIGNGYILIYKFPKGFIGDKSSIGCIMLVDYQKSNVGPYQELLFIPGKIKIKKHKNYSISKIYVSTQISVDNGIDNWAIPKELADFEFNTEKVSIKKNQEIFFEAKFKTRKFSFPINSKLLPFKIAQEKDNKVFLTSPFGKGYAKLSKLEHIKVNEKYFPDISKLKPILTLKINNFKLTFPKAKIYESR